MECDGQPAAVRLINANMLISAILMLSTSSKGLLFRWCLTGTPIVNKASDMWALFNFLAYACAPLKKPSAALLPPSPPVWCHCILAHRQSRSEEHGRNRWSPGSRLALT